MNINEIFSQQPLAKPYTFMGDCHEEDTEDSSSFMQNADIDATQLAQLLENSHDVPPQKFIANVDMGEIMKLRTDLWSGRYEYLYNADHDIYILYDTKDDIHYFYARVNESVNEGTYHVGDRVGFNSEGGHITGKVVKVHTKDFDYKGYTHHATPDDPQYEIKDDDSDHVAAHKGAALHRV